MPLDLGSLTFQERTVVVDFGADGTLEVVWAPGKLTPAKQSALVAASDAEGPAAMAELLASVIVRWDLTVNGEPAPLTGEFMQHLPLAVLGFVWKAIGEATRVGEANGAT